VTSVALLEVTKTGCGIGVLQASEMGRSVYTQLGFKEYPRFEFHKLDDRVIRVS
jgi:hypothetical protein